MSKYEKPTLFLPYLQHEYDKQINIIQVGSCLKTNLLLLLLMLSLILGIGVGILIRHVDPEFGQDKRKVLYFMYPGDIELIPGYYIVCFYAISINVLHVMELLEEIRKTCRSLKSSRWTD